MNEEDPNVREANLYSVVLEALRKSGEYGKIKASIQTKVLEIVKGDDDTTEIGSPVEKIDPLFVLLNQLILEYFHWYGYQYSIQMFSTESGINPNCPSRIYLESILGKHNERVPILIELIYNAIGNKQAD